MKTGEFHFLEVGFRKRKEKKAFQDGKKNEEGDWGRRTPGVGDYMGKKNK